MRSLRQQKPAFFSPPDPDRWILPVLYSAGTRIHLADCDRETAIVIAGDVSGTGDEMSANFSIRRKRTHYLYSNGPTHERTTVLAGLWKAQPPEQRELTGARLRRSWQGCSRRVGWSRPFSLSRDRLGEDLAGPREGGTEHWR